MGLTNLCTKRQRIAELARSKRGVALSTLHHVIDVEWMKEAYRLTRKDGAPGIDGVMAEDYAQNLEANLSDLLERIKSGRYHAPPVRRAYIPKADGSLRPLGLPTFEDKVCQRAIVMVLELVYEQDFLSCSYGFRPGRSAHQALEDLRTGFMRHGLRWVIDLDIEKYFDSISHPHLRTARSRRRLRPSESRRRFSGATSSCGRRARPDLLVKGTVGSRKMEPANAQIRRH